MSQGASADFSLLAMGDAQCDDSEHITQAGNKNHSYFVIQLYTKIAILWKV